MTNDITHQRKGNLTIRMMAEKTISECGVFNHGTYKTNLFTILKKIGFHCMQFTPNAKTKNIAGAVFHKDKKIYISEGLELEEMLFTLAHEIGHVILHPNESRVDFLQKQLDDERGTNNEREKIKEQEADVFAYELLMPFFKFHQASNFEGYSVAKLAKLFEVSEVRVRERLAFIAQQTI